MDRSQIIGLSLLAVIMFGWLWYIQPSEEELQQQKTDSLANTSTIAQKPMQEPLPVGVNETGLPEKDSFFTLSTNNIVYTFNLRGGALVKAVLLNFKQTQHDTNQHIFFTYKPIWYNLYNNTQTNYDHYFSLVADHQLEDRSRELIFETLVNGKKLQHIYRVDDNNKDGLLHWTIAAADFMHFFPNEHINFYYAAQLYPAESSLSYEQQMSNIGYSTDEGEYDYIRLAKNIDETIEEPLTWINYKQRFFSSTFIAANLRLQQVKFKGSSQATSFDEQFADITSSFTIPIPSTQNQLSFSFYIGDNTYKKLAALPYTNMNEIVDYGSGIFSFVKYINRGLVLPFFTWISLYVENMGWVIALLTIFIRLLTSPLLYSSYLSSAKMRALRPELAELKRKVGDDKQKYSLEQMNLFRQAGVNPLGGCMPALLQIPIFFALYSFFNAHIQLRGEPFWWTTDLSTYDSILTLPFSIPFYGDHVSLFNITATITSFLISLFGMSLNTSPEMQSNPAMKYMPYIFPFFLLFIFNSMPAALTWYYTISNSITLAIQLVINKFIIDHDKIVLKIEANKKKSKNKPSSFQKRMELFQQMKQEKKK